MPPFILSMMSLDPSTKMLATAGKTEIWLTLMGRYDSSNLRSDLSILSQQTSKDKSWVAMIVDE